MFRAMIALPAFLSAAKTVAFGAARWILAHPWQVAVGVLILALLWQRHQYTDARDARDEAQAALLDCRAANGRTAATVTALQTVNGECMAQWRESQGRAESAVVSLREWLESRPPGHVERVREREVIYRDPDCDQLARTDIAAVCPALADRLRHLRADH